MSRPEHIAPPEVFYNASEARKYTANSRMIQIQYELTRRCLELLKLPPEKSCYLLDIGCGSGLSGEELSEEGHVWVGLDISADMLDVANERECEGDLLLQDMGQGMHFRPGTFDGVISVSALQWLCNADKRSHDPRKRMQTFFTSLYSCMAHGARAVFQFYPDSPAQMQLLVTYAMKAGFGGGIVIDYPNSTRAKKIFLVIFAGVVGALPSGKDGDSDQPDDQASYVASARGDKRGKGNRVSVKSREWVQQKKDRRRRQMGETDVRPDSKYTARKRRPKF